MLHREQNFFRPSDNATRAEFAQLIIDVQGGIRQSSPSKASFVDVPSTEWYFPYMEEAGRLRWIKGDGDCYGRKPCFARPDGSINRAEAAALLVRAFGFEATNLAPYFSDNRVGNWYTDVVQTAADHCILRGDDATKRVRPADYMNRAEMIAMVDRANKRQTYGIDCGSLQATTPRIASVRALSATTITIDFTVDINPGSVGDTLRYAITSLPEYVAVSAKQVRPQGVEITFNKSFLPTKQYAVSVKNLVSTTGELFSDTGTFSGIAAPAAATSALTVTTNPISVIQQPVPKGALHVPVLSLTLQASCEEGIVVDGVDLVRDGPGSLSDIEGIYALINGQRITRKRTIESQNHTVSLAFAKPVSIPACQSVTVDVAADFQAAATVSGQHRFSVRSPASVRANTQRIGGSFPLQGQMLSIAAVPTGILTFEYRSIAPVQIEVGRTKVVTGKFQVSANSVEHQTLRHIVLRQNGSVKVGDLRNLSLRTSDGTKISTTVQQTSSDATLFAFEPPFLVRQGDTKTIELVADIIGGAGRTIEWKLEEESDLLAVGSDTGRSSALRTIGSRVLISSKIQPAILVVDAGGFILETDGPAQQSYANDDRAAVLSNITMTSGDEPASVRSLYILVQGQSINGSGFGNSFLGVSDDEISEVIKNVKLRNVTTGKTVSATRLSGPNDAVSSTAKTYQVYRFDNFTVRGKEQWQFLVDFVNNGPSKHPTTGDKFRIYLCGEPSHVRNQNGALATNKTGCAFGGLLGAPSTAYQLHVEGLSTGDRIADVRPRGSIAGNFHSISNAALLVSVQLQGTAGTTIRGAKNVPLLRFEARAGTTRDLRMTKLVFVAAEGSFGNGQGYSLWRDTTGNGTPDTVVQSGVTSQSNVLTFGNMDSQKALLKGGEVTVFEVRAAIASSPPSSVLQLAFASQLSNYMEVERVDGSNLSGIRTNAVCTGTCDISVTTVPAPRWTIGTQGNLFVSQSSSPIRSRHLLGGTLSDPVLRVKFRSENEPIDVTHIFVTSALSNASSVERLELFEGTNTTPFATATTAGCGSDPVIRSHGGVQVQTFCAIIPSQKFVIPAQAEREVFVRARVKDDRSGGMRGQAIQFWISGAAIGDVGAIRATGLSSSSDLAFNNGDAFAQGEIFIGRSVVGDNADIVGSTHTVVMAKLQSLGNGSSDPSGSAIPVGLSRIGAFRFTAAENSNTNNGKNTIVLDGIIFTVNATNVQLRADTFSIANTETPNSTASCTVFDDTGSQLSGIVTGPLSVVCQNLQGASVGSVLEANTSTSLALYGDVVSAGSGKGSAILSVSLQRIADTSRSNFGTDQSHIRWFDSDASGSKEHFWFELPDPTVNSTTYRN